MRKIGKFEIVDHGMSNFELFKSSGPIGMEYEILGIGTCLAEAINHCLDQISQLDFDIENMEERILKQENWEAFPTKPWTDFVSPIYYFVSINWSEER